MKEKTEARDDKGTNSWVRSSSGTRSSRERPTTNDQRPTTTDQDYGKVGGVSCFVANLPFVLVSFLPLPPGNSDLQLGNGMQLWPIRLGPSQTCRFGGRGLPD